MSRPKLLDLFCGAGGAAMGYHRAGFKVVGVDHKPQPRYPFEFIQADAMTFPLERFDVIHASPPCQAYTPLRHLTKKEYPELLAPCRDRLDDSGLPYVIENVPGAPLMHGTMLCGEMFGLRTYRHRWFESTHVLLAPSHPKHITPTNSKKRNRKEQWEAGHHATVVGDIGSYVGPEAMGIDWMTGRELSQAIPPAYTEWIGRQLIRMLS